MPLNSGLVSPIGVVIRPDNLVVVKEYLAIQNYEELIF